VGRVLKKWLPIAIATFTGILVLLGYLFPDSMRVAYAGGYISLRDLLVEWAIVLGVFAFVLGLFNVLRVHGGRVVRTRPGWVGSLALMVSALLAIIPGLLGPRAPLSRAVWMYLLGPSGAALAALMVFGLALAAFRLVRTRFSLWSLLFLAAAIVTMLGSVTPVGMGWLGQIRTWLVRVPATAGVRGLLLGVALGTVVTAVRVLLASERPHSET
jgi:hypothetical protein